MNNIKKMLKKDLNKFETPPMEKVISLKKSQKAIRHTEFHRRRVGFAVATTMLACLLVIGCGAVLHEIVTRLNSPKITDVTHKLIDVPEGYIGIYSLDDLLLINNEENRESNFIFMSDIAIPDEIYAEGGMFEGGMEPLGHYDGNKYFSGEINGNGYTVSNVKLKSVTTQHNVVVGLFGYSKARIVHLGIEDVNIILELDRNLGSTPLDVYVGSLAAQAEYVIGCYAKNVDLHFSDEEKITNQSCGNVMIGGLCGFSSYIDSCFVTGASVTTSISNEWDNVMVGGISGTANACVTSYFQGSVSTNKGVEENVYIDTVCAMHYSAYTPRLLSEEAMNALREKLNEQGYDSGDFSFVRFLASYIKYDQSDYSHSDAWKTVLSPQVLDYTDNFYAVEGEININNTAWYVMDSHATVEDFKKLTDFIIEAFDGDERAVQQFFIEYNIKTGKLFCYSFNSGEKISINSLEGFDFERIWVQDSEEVIQKIFVEE